MTDTELIWACRNNEVDVVDRLISDGADVDEQQHQSKEFALLVATQEGHAAIVKLLVEANANVNLQDKGGRTPLHKAVEYGHAAIVEFLVNNDADRNLQDSMGWTPMKYGQVSQKSHKDSGDKDAASRVAEAMKKLIISPISQ